MTRVRVRVMTVTHAAGDKREPKRISGDENAIHGKVVVMTGATSGIGQVAAEHLAKNGARIIFVARDSQRAAVTLDRLQTVSCGRHHVACYADLSSLSEMKRVGEEIAAAEPRIDVLINNAGALFSRREITQDGLERTFALNHMAYFVLTAALRDRLIASAPARIIVTASNAHRKGRLDLDDLQSARNNSASVAYRTSKLCNILFTRELAHRLAPHGVTANSFSPGFVATRFGDEAGGLPALALRAGKLFAKTPEEGARTLVYLASEPGISGVSGEFFYNCCPGRILAEASDAGKGRRLWTESERIADCAE